MDRKQDASGILTVKKVVLYFVRDHFAASGKTGHRKGNAYVIAVDLRPIRQWKIEYTLKKNHRAVHTGAGPGVYRDRSGAVYHADTAGTRRTAAKQGNFKY